MAVLGSMHADVAKVRYPTKSHLQNFAAPTPPARVWFTNDATAYCLQITASAAGFYLLRLMQRLCGHPDHFAPLVLSYSTAGDRNILPLEYLDAQRMSVKSL
jgi:hypothetical protein